MKKIFWKKLSLLGLSAVMLALTFGCGSAAPGDAGSSETRAESKDSADTESGKEPKAETESGSPAESGGEKLSYSSDSGYQDEDAEIQVFIAASLNTAVTDLVKQYNEIHPKVKISLNADSSGKLLTQIEEGYSCDVFFSAAQKQMNTLEKDDKLLVEGTRKNVVNNQLCVITQKDSETKVTGLENLKDAKSIALADGSVPAGKYTRQALMALKILAETEDVSKITTEQVSEALGGVEISEQSNVSKVLAAVVEGSCEVGTTYYSDTHGYEDKLRILEKVPYELTGKVIYPIAQVQNKEATDADKKAAKDFIDFVTSEAAKSVFESYYFDTNTGE